MSQTFGERSPFRARLHKGFAAAADHLVDRLTLSDLGLQFSVELEEDGRPILIVRGHAGLAPELGSSDLLEIVPVTGNSIGLRLRRGFPAPDRGNE